VHSGFDEESLPLPPIGDDPDTLLLTVRAVGPSGFDRASAAAQAMSRAQACGSRASAIIGHVLTLAIEMGSASSHNDEIRFHRIVIRPDTISEVDGLPLVTLPRSEIIQIRVTRGLLTERPLIAIVAGIVLTAIGVFGIKLLYSAFFTDGPALPKTGALASLCLALGPLLIYSATRRGPCLHVETTKGVRVLQFGKTLDPQELPGFVDRASRAGLIITGS
jgi:hypothetical protein